LINKIFKLINKLKTPVNWYKLRRLESILRVFGFKRDTPINRIYIELFLNFIKLLNFIKQYIQGVTCEIAEDTYSEKYVSNVEAYEIFYYTNNNPKVIIVGILTDINTLPKNKIDVLF
jgi:hypothetical protein